MLLIKCDLSIEGLFKDLTDPHWTYIHTVPIFRDSGLPPEVAIAIVGEGLYITEVTTKRP